MKTETHISKKLFWVIVLIAVICTIFLAIILEKMQNEPILIDSQAPPLFSLPSGLYHTNESLQLSTSQKTKAQILYTLNGQTPTIDNAILYDSPIPLNAGEPNVMVVRARTILPDGTSSDESVGTYFMRIETELPMVSLVAEPDDLWSADRGILTNISMRGADWERPAYLTYLDENGRLGFSIPAGIRLHGQGSNYSDKKSLRIYFRREYGPGRLRYPLYPKSDVTNFDRLVLHSGGQDNALYSANWTLMRTQLIAKLSEGINTYTTHNQPVLVFLNGELYGIYYLRERIDETYFQDHLGIEGAKILNAPHRDQDQPIEVEDWWELEAYAAENNMANPEHYAYVLSQIDVENMIDHYILQMYAANTDWPYNNDVLFRGEDPLSRWRWFLWDVDYSFGMLPASNVEFDMVTWMMDPQSPEVQAATRFFRSLWQNPNFRNQFLVRTADLLNTTLAPKNVSNELEEVQEAIEADIGYEIARWGSPGNWYKSADEMHTFVQQRPNIMRQQFVDGFSLPGTAVLTIKPPNSGKGSITLNDSITPTLPYTGEYFLDTTISLTPQPEQGFQFAGWEVNGEIVETEPPLYHTFNQDSIIIPRFTSNSE